MSSSIVQPLSRLSKYLKKKHKKFLKEYVYALVLDGQVKKAINQIKSSRNSPNSNFFEAKLLLALDLIGKKKYKQSSILETEG